MGCLSVALFADARGDVVSVFHDPCKIDGWFLLKGYERTEHLIGTHSHRMVRPSLLSAPANR